jgi:type IV pilus assembly protein PilW
MKTQRGLSLIELMVALTIGLFMLGGLGLVFLSMNQTFTLRERLSALQENERMAMSILGTSIHNAGFYPDPLNVTAATQFPASGSFVATQVISGTTGAGNTDTLSVRFAAGATSSQGCSSSLIAGNLYTDIFSVAGGYLVCTETNNTAGTTSVVNLIGSDSTIGSVKGMSMLYGVDTTGAGSTTEYLNATQVAAAGLWASVKTIQITLIFNNPLQGQPGQNPTVSLTQTIPYLIGL